MAPEFSEGGPHSGNESFVSTESEAEKLLSENDANLAWSFDGRVGQLSGTIREKPVVINVRFVERNNVGRFSVESGSVDGQKVSNQALADLFDAYLGAAQQAQIKRERETTEAAEREAGEKQRSIDAVAESLMPRKEEK